MPSWERIGGLPGKILIKNRPVQSQTAAQDGFWGLVHPAGVEPVAFRVGVARMGF